MVGRKSWRLSLRKRKWLAESLGDFRYGNGWPKVLATFATEIWESSWAYLDQFVQMHERFAQPSAVVAGADSDQSRDLGGCMDRVSRCVLKRF
ncbi:hypothetical protein K227x_47410 [Rubripirellula lacrimiformis]|uniref:Uncharacterized protein n=1 Tax=Rubripirellula lacrimiformis TaxID=1930273 RepID=A0A517NGS5_9BACT|nr:hypothetical protein K227x_47410 [Rubripirellula lacrimiformis]